MIDHDNNASASPSSSVHTLETPSHATQHGNEESVYVARKLEMDYRHGGTRGRRERIRRGLEGAGVPGGRLERWDDCGRFATVERSLTTEGRLRINCNRCHDRFCPACGTERSRTIGHNVVNALENRPHRFITLTVKHGREPLQELTDHLEESFKKLRRSSLWRTSVLGGAAFLEVKYVNGWHPHLHIIVQGNWMDHKELCKAWLKATTTSSIVHIELIKDTLNTASYVTKYASKPIDTSVILNHDHLIEAILTLRGRKLMTTFGTWRKIKLTEKVSDEVWETVASLKELVEREQMGDHDATEILNALRSQIQWQKEEQERQESARDGPHRSSRKARHSAHTAETH